MDAIRSQGVGKLFKPDNFVVGLNENANVIFLIDYGLSKRFRNPTTKEHIPYYLYGSSYL